MIQVRATAFVVLAVIGCEFARPPPASPVSPAPSASVALAQEMPSDAREQEPSAPSRSLLVTGSRTIGRTSPAEEARSYRGARIDLDVKGADLHEVCRLIADVGRVNIVVSDEVRGTVTVKMKGVPWDQALDTILRAKGYRAERDGSVILVTR